MWAQWEVGSYLLVVIVIAIVQANVNDDLDGLEVEAPQFDTDLIHNQEHIEGHLKHKVKIQAEKMTKDAMQFHFFQEHDFDKNMKLDGWELMASLKHSSAYLKNLENVEQRGKKAGQPPSEIEKIKRKVEEIYMKKVERIIDDTLRDNDLDRDGYLTYMEYKKAIRLKVQMQDVKLPK